MAGFIHRRMEDAHDMKVAPALVEQNRVPTDHPAPYLTGTNNAPRTNLRPLAQQLERRVDHFGIGDGLLATPCARAIAPYFRKIAMGAARDNQSERNCDLVSFR